MSEQGKDAERLAPTATEAVQVEAGPSLALSAYVRRGAWWLKREALDADDPESWPTKWRERYGTEIADDCGPDWWLHVTDATDSLPKSERPKSEASEPAPEAAHTDQGAR